MDTPEAGAAAPRHLTRRSFLTKAGGAAAGAAAFSMGGWTPAFISTAGAAPPGFPAGISIYQQGYRNWAGDIVVDSVWTCAPTSSAQVLQVANWARGAGHRLRARGRMHNWSPLTVPPGSTNANVVLVDLTQHLKTATITGGTPATVRAGTGITMEALLTQLESAGYGLTATPAPGDLTLGGVLAIDGHGTGIPASGETRVTGSTYGSLSNLITSITAVVWDSATNQYVLRTYPRSNPACLALLTHVGRSMVTEVTLQVRANHRLRCQSWFDIHWQDLFAPASSSFGRKLSNYLSSAGRVEAIWFPFTGNPWLKVWSVSPNKPFFAKQVNGPYNYGFSDSLGQDATDLVAGIIGGDPSLADDFGNLQISVVGSGLITTGTWDIWGWSKNTMLYVKPTTLRVTANGYAILCRRSDVQRVVNEFATTFNAKLQAYKNQGRWPINGPVEIRVTGLDKAGEVDVASAGPPTLSALRPRPDRPEWDTAVWLDILTIPGTPHSNTFMREVEQWIFSNYSGTYAGVRVEWSKGWGYSTSAAWADGPFISGTVPASIDAGQPAGSRYADARASLNAADPHKVFSNPFLNTLLP
jgi:FAD/FMN-containing dehydrogenase